MYCDEELGAVWKLIVFLAISGCREAYNTDVVVSSRNEVNRFGGGASQLFKTKQNCAGVFRIMKPFCPMLVCSGFEMSDVFTRETWVCIAS